MLSSHSAETNMSYFNPTMTLFESEKINHFSFPDPNTYYVLSDAGKNYSLKEYNMSILINFNKGYFEPIFNVDIHKTKVLNMSNMMFGGTMPISGSAKAALEIAILKIGKKKSTLRNRL